MFEEEKFGNLNAHKHAQSDANLHQRMCRFDGFGLNVRDVGADEA